MALVVKDRVKETSTSTGTGSFTLSGAVAGFQTFASTLTDGDTTYYAITDAGTGDFEVGLGTYNSGVLTRDTVFETHNGLAFVDFNAGEKEVFITYPADKAVYLDADGKVAPTTALMDTIRANDGAGSGLNADLLDGLQASDFVLKAGDTVSGDLIISGDLTVNGTTTTVNATNLAIADNMIYMNDGSTVTNPDLGWSGNYNDGTYAHAGFFRDATDGRFKAYDGYTPEPDASPYIDTSHASFSLADIEANTFYGNLTGTATNANKWTTERTITLGGDLTGSVSIDGTANVVLTAAINDDSHFHVISNIDGLQTALDAKADDTTLISAGTGLTGGGSIGVNRTLSLDTAYTDGRYVNSTGDTMSGNLSSTAFIGTAQSSTTPSTDDARFDGFGVQGNRTNNPVYIHNHGNGGVRISSNATLGTSNGVLVTDGGLNVTGNIILSGTVDGRDVAADGTKLDGIEVGATADQTPTEILTAIKTVDGSGSGLDADTLDGIQGSSFLRKDGVSYSDSFTGDLNSVTGFRLLRSQGATNAAFGSHHNVITLPNTSATQYDVQLAFETDNAPEFKFRSSAAGAWSNWTQAFHDGYHPNADKWTTARTLTLNGDVSGSVAWDGSGNVTLTTTVADDSHNHVISNVDGLQAALDGKLDESINAATYLATSTYGLNTNVNNSTGGWARAHTFTHGFSTSNKAAFGALGNDNSITYAYINANTTDATGYNEASALRVYPTYPAWGTSVIWHAGNDGSGSGLDADLLDGQQGSYYYSPANAPDPTLTINGDASGSATFTNLGNATLTLTVADDSHNHVISNVDGLQTALDGKLSTSGGTVSGNLVVTGDIDVAAQTGTWIQSDVMTDAIGWNTSYGVYIGSNVGGTHYLRGNGTFTTNGSTYSLWHAGNDGSGSGLDADLLDGQHGSYYYSPANPPVASAKNDIFWENGQTVTTNYTITNGKNAMSAGPITINSGVTVTVGAGETWTVV